MAFGKSKVDTAFRFRAAREVVFVLFAILIARLWYVQIVHGDYYRIRSENNRFRESVLPAPRGLIVDRDGTVLVRNRPALLVEFTPEDAPDPEVTLRRLAEIANVDEEVLFEAARDTRRRRRFEPRILLRDPSLELVSRLYAHLFELPGVHISHYPSREYVHGESMAHVLGYIGEISAEELRDSTFAGYRMGDVVGKYGIERRYERSLRGEDGRRQVIVNARGQRVQDYAVRPELPGQDLVLTVSFPLQRVAEVAFGNQRGAAVAMDINTGEILALVSRPAFNPNQFVSGMDGSTLRALFGDFFKPMNNRAVQGAYPPGSVFKTFMLVAGFEEELISPTDRVMCPGFYRFGNRNYRCHKRTGHGSENYHEALVESCDVFFYVLGQRLTVDRIHDYATRFGFGSRTGLELVAEQPGLVPSTAWKRRRFAGTPEERWHPGETLSVAIGQGAMLTTPIQLAVAHAALFNGGKLLRPKIVKGVRSPFSPTQSVEPEVMGEIDLPDVLIERLRAALRDVVYHPSGTARRAQLPRSWNIEVGGKTGTSQVVALSHETEAEHLQDHALFAAVAPIDAPEIAIVVLVENGGSGGRVAAPIAREMLATYFFPRVLQEQRQ